MNKKELLPLEHSRYGPIVANPKDSDESNTPPAVLEWRRQEKAWNEQAAAWARDMLAQHFSTDDSAYQQRTAAQILADVLDSSPTMPSAWARLVKSETVSYTKRYEITRNALEALARKRAVVVGTTTNALGRERSSTYARPRNESDNWNIATEAISPSVKAAGEQRIRDWLALDGGSVLEGLQRVTLIRKMPGGADAIRITGRRNKDRSGPE